MKIIDRYVFKTFLKNYLMSFMILVGLYIILDMLFNFKDLMAIQGREGSTDMNTAWGMLQTVGDYYFYQMFVFYAQLSGIIPVVAAAFTLMRMSRFNELSALLSAGVPLLRVSLPIVVATVFLNGLLLVDQELLIPQMIPKLTRSHAEANQTAGRRVFSIPAMQAENRILLVAARYCEAGASPEITTPTMEKISIIERDEQMLPITHLAADKAQWDPSDQSWVLTNAVFTTGLNTPNATAQKLDDGYKYTKTSVTPEEIALYKTGDFIQLLSTERINELLKRPLAYGVNQLLRVQHGRFTQPIINIIVLLLAIPCVLTRQPGKLKAAALKCLILMGFCLGTVFLSQLLASQPPNAQVAATWPAIMAWVPIFIYGPFAVWLLDHVET